MRKQSHGQNVVGFDSGGRSPSTKKFRFSRKTPLKSPIVRQRNMVTQRPRVATELFSKKVTKIRHENDSPRSEPVSIDHDYVKVNRKNESEQIF